ncbi:MAG: thiamine ABC transporter substrate-binding protein [Candidatus Heimdallarchaeota archaeon]
MYQRNMKTLLIIISVLTLPLSNSKLTHTNNVSGYDNSPGFEQIIINADGDQELVIYTHDSFLAWGLDPVTTLNTAFFDWGVANDVSITLKLFNGMVDALNILILEKNAPVADVVIGLDSIMVNRAKEAEVLMPYLDANLENISTSLIAALDPEKYLLPIDYGLIAFIFDTEFISASNYPGLSDLSFDNLLATFGEDFVVQDPTLSATGINFLLYQIIFYGEILDQDWKSWWQAAKGLVTIAPSWSDSWDRVFDAKEDHMMVSYGTDPAYNAFFNYSFEQNAALISKDSTKYSWMQIEGIGLVNGATNISLAKSYIDFALSPEVQNLIAINNWMFPANTEVTLPPCYDYAITAENVTILNDLVTADYISANYQIWLNEWEQLIYDTGFWWLWVLIPAVVLLVGIIVTVVLFTSSKKLNID